ncbi:hypothetical protein DEO72_LG5g1514 [Vigna unguiculata]|uniref:Uncharacterized protein n=1 Tax=Vigna unguiculata TaxID=3917 RepID=A0A4D6LWM5_VIGUN|nr:hypothetical protein DEO72_LG5g1514 [Vigna unguiculata]
MAAAATATTSSSDHHTSRILHHLPLASNHLHCNEQPPSSTFKQIHEPARLHVPAPRRTINARTNQIHNHHLLRAAVSENEPEQQRKPQP